MPGLARNVEKLWKYSAKPGDLAARLQSSHDHFGFRLGTEQVLMQLLLGGRHFVQQALELGELANQLQDRRHVGRCRRLNVQAGHGSLPTSIRTSGMVPCIIK